jgi:ABC-type branched-subunit amino acid transport system substrate-binding protein
LFAAAIFVFSSATIAAELSPMERAGRDMFTNGAAEIIALVGAGETPVPTSVVPCTSCHGADGRGRTEGGIAATDITHAALAVPYGAITTAGRKHGPYTDRLLKRAIAMGIDASGNRLDPVMPRYQLSAETMNALLSYMKKLGDPEERGITRGSVRVGVLLPPKEHLAETGEEVSAILRAWVNSRNASGGVYERKLDLVFSDAGGSAAERAAAAKAFVKAAQPFAFVSSFTDGADAELAAMAEAERIPLLATISSRPRSSVAPNRYVRDLVAGIDGQARALAIYAARQLHATRIAILAVTGDGASTLAADQLRALGLEAMLVSDATSPATLRESGVDAIVFVGSPSRLRELLAGRTTEWNPAVLLPAPLAGPDAITSVQTARLWLALPLSPREATPDAVAAYRELLAVSGGQARHQAAQFAALASLQLFVAALESAGRDVTADRFLDAIDGIKKLETGLVQPLSYAPTRHIGSTGSYVIALGEGTGDHVTWVDPD